MGGARQNKTTVTKKSILQLKNGTVFVVHVETMRGQNTDDRKSSAVCLSLQVLSISSPSSVVMVTW